MTDLNANYIIQKVIHLQPSSKLGFISELFMDKVISTHPRLRSTATTPTPVECCSGLSSKSPPEWSSRLTQRDQIFSQIEDKLTKLSYCQFGNYLIQHLAEKGTDKYKKILADIIVENIIPMSSDKFASNVVERAIEHWNLDFIERLFEELKKPNHEKPDQ